MTANVGTDSFTTVESKAGEQNHTQWVKDVVSEYGPDFTILYKESISDIVGPEHNEYAYLKNGKSSYYEADGGFIFYKNVRIGVCEHKHQSATENACERALKYLSYLPDHQLFVSTSGPGFSPEKMRKKSSATAKFIAILKYGYINKGLERGPGLSHNEDEEGFKKTFRDWFEYLIEKHTDYVIVKHTEEG